MAFEQERIDQIIESCLASMENGQDNVDSLLENHPDIADILRPYLEAADWLIDRKLALDPRPGYLSNSRRRLLAQIRKEDTHRSPQIRAPARYHFWGLFQRRFVFPIALALLMVFSLFAVSTGVALATQLSLPGDALYPFKVTVEDVELKITTSAMGDGRLNIRFAQRRLNEIQALILEGSYEKVPETVNRFEQHVAQVVQVVHEVSGRESGQAKELANSLRETLSVQTTSMVILSGIAPEQTVKELERAIEVSNTGVSAVEAWLTDESDPAIIWSTPTSAPTFTSTPEITDTPLPSPTTGLVASSTATMTATATGELLLDATATQVVTAASLGRPTATFTVTPTVRKPRLTQTKEPSPTSAPTATPQPTATRRPPTETPEPTNTPPPTPTSPAPPTNTPRPAPTFTPIPSETPYPGP